MTAWRPSQEVLLLAGTPAGGGQDRAARALASALRHLEVPVRVENAPGRGGADAWEALAARAGDAHALSISSPTLVTNPLTGVAEVGGDDLTILATLCTEYIVFAVPEPSRAQQGSRSRPAQQGSRSRPAHPGLRSRPAHPGSRSRPAHPGPVADARQLLAALAAAEPPVTALATARGNVNHIALARLGRHVGVSGRSLPVRVFDSARHAIADVLAGEADVVAVSAASVLPEVSAGSLRPLAVSAPTALAPPLDAVPIWEDEGVACTIGTWRGVVAAPGLAAEQRAFWSGVLADAVGTEPWRAALEAHVWSPTFLDAAATTAFLGQQRDLLGEALADLGLLAP